MCIWQTTVYQNALIFASFLVNKNHFPGVYCTYRLSWFPVNLREGAGDPGAREERLREHVGVVHEPLHLKLWQIHKYKDLDGVVHEPLHLKLWQIHKYKDLDGVVHEPLHLKLWQIHKYKDLDGVIHESHLKLWACMKI